VYKRLTEPVTIPQWMIDKYKKLPFTEPYYLILGGVLGAISAGFGAVIVIIILVATNFNALGWVE
jgi:hypothetical protein